MIFSHAYYPAWYLRSFLCRQQQTVYTHTLCSENNENTPVHKASSAAEVWLEFGQWSYMCVKGVQSTHCLESAAQVNTCNAVLFGLVGFFLLFLIGRFYMHYLLGCTKVMSYPQWFSPPFIVIYHLCCSNTE